MPLFGSRDQRLREHLVRLHDEQPAQIFRTDVVELAHQVHVANGVLVAFGRR
jgi:hypothetical protein